MSCSRLIIQRSWLQEVPMALKTKCLLGLFGFAVVDAVIPFPILGMILVYVVVQKPPWFQKVVREIYGG
jgi:hypothetical protein